MDPLLAIVVALISLFSVIVGVSLHYVYTRLIEKRKHSQSLQTETYVSYLRSVGEAEQLRSETDDGRKREILARAIEAKARMCVYGSTEVVDTLARFEGCGGDGLTPEKKELFLNFVSTVRSETNVGEPKLRAESIESILFGKRPAA